MYNLSELASVSQEIQFLLYIFLGDNNKDTDWLKNQENIVYVF